ncbi:hypothetical protein OPV22_003643 [Ensete ventricosum]|uniref:Uncharacterized protein n=1 Tax=Ensete ventricosum TaxID=4639 RepID=A0AAV8S1J5_ENSVE|nr:hypothetical protein OPV22_003643 [Ensete ventricosum]
MYGGHFAGLHAGGSSHESALTANAERNNNLVAKVWDVSACLHAFSLKTCAVWVFKSSGLCGGGEDELIKASEMDGSTFWTKYN